jgi:multidrug resistance efflux pump
MVAQIEGLMLFRLDKRRRRTQFDTVRASLRKALLALATMP